MAARNRVATIVRPAPSGYDEYGDPVETGSSRIDVEGCAWARRDPGSSGSEIDTRGREGTVTWIAVYMPPGTVVLPSDGVELDGALYQVHGEPAEWPGTAAGGVEVVVWRAEG